MATDDINVFGSLRDFIADQSMQAVERDKMKLEAIRAAQEQFTPTPAQSAYLSAIFAPGSGIVDAVSLRKVLGWMLKILLEQIKL